MAGVCDFVILIDATGSMKPCMDALVENIGLFLDGLASAQTPIHDWRGKVVGYRDALVVGDPWFEDNPFVTDVGALRDQLQKLEPKGGGDDPESLLDALLTVVQRKKTTQSSPDYEWRPRGESTRVVICFTDAIYHETISDKVPENVGGTLNDIKNTIIGAKVHIFLFAPDHDLYEKMNTLPQVLWEDIPGPDFQEGLKTFTQDTKKFSEVMAALAESVSKSATVAFD